MAQWEKKMVPGTGSDPLAKHIGVPILGKQGINAQYVGRVIVELWDHGDGVDDSYHIAYSIEPAIGDAKTLIKRVAAALPARVKRSLNRPYP
jgi:hypothetical protein